MARTSRDPCLIPMPGARPQKLLNVLPPGKTNWEECFKGEINDDAVFSELDKTSVVIVSHDYLLMSEDPDPEDEPDEIWRNCRSTQATSRVWRTTVMYERLSGIHPRIVPFFRREPWTGFPIVAKPSGPPLDIFLAKKKEVLYLAQDATSTNPPPRVQEKYRPLIYQWALHLLSGLAFVHQQCRGFDQFMVFGDLHVKVCWLSSPELELSLLGFMDADQGPYFYDRGGRFEYSVAFHPLQRNDIPTVKTDLFLWGCLVYQLVTGFWPGEGRGLAEHVIENMVSGRKWPALESKYLGEVVRRCWDYEFADARELKRELVRVLAVEGWEVEGEDTLKGFQAQELVELLE